MRNGKPRKIGRILPQLEAMESRALLTSTSLALLGPPTTVAGLTTPVVSVPTTGDSSAPINPLTTVIHGPNGYVEWDTPSTTPIVPIDYTKIPPTDPATLAAKSSIPASSPNEASELPVAGTSVQSTTFAATSAAGSINPVVVPTTPGISHATYVADVYQLLLDRAPSSKDLGFWTRLAARRGDQAVYQAVVNSPEYISRLASETAASLPITSPDVFAEANSAPKATTLLSPATPVAAGSTALVNQAYASLLGRAPAPTDIAFWTKVAAQRGDFYVLEAITKSPEHLLR